MLPLVGSCDLRDFGGYATVDGRGVIGGRVYRSGVLSYLTPDDHACLAPLGLRTIVDLRRPDEIAGIARDRSSAPGGRNAAPLPLRGGAWKAMHAAHWA
jgi:hypothetical protein